MFLTPEQVTDLTGSGRTKRQIDWLVENGIKFMVDLKGRPKVLTAEIDGMKCGKHEKSITSPHDLFIENYNSYLFNESHIIKNAEQYNYDTSPHIKGIYFLIHENEIVYVGKSISIRTRLDQHIHSGKHFTQYWYFEYELPFIDKIEGFYIHLLQPRLNIKYPYIESPDNVIENLLGDKYKPRNCGYF